MFYKRSILDALFNDMESMMGNFQPTYYKISPNGFVMSYKSKVEDKEISNLKKDLEIAVEKQNFEEAVNLRDQIKSLESNGKKINELQTQLNEAIHKQDFETAIELRDEIKNLKV